MASRGDDPTPSPPHSRPVLSSLVVRPSRSDSSGGSGDESGGRRKSPPHYSLSHRRSYEPGNRNRTRYLSPVLGRNSGRRHSPDLNHPPCGQELRSHRGSGIFRDSTPPIERGRTGPSRPYGRSFGGPALDPGPFRVEPSRKNNPNVRPREGDWYCPDPACNNLNFARREYCHSCNRPRQQRGPYGSVLPSFPSPWRFNVPQLDRSPRSRYLSPPQKWTREDPGRADFIHMSHHRHNYLPRRDRPSYVEDEYRGRDAFDRPVQQVWDRQDEPRVGFHCERNGYERQPLSLPFQPPPFHAGQDRWGRVMRARSRSPIHGSSKGYHQDLHMDRGRDDRSGGRNRIGRAY